MFLSLLLKYLTNLIVVKITLKSLLENLKGKTAISDCISNCNNCKNKRKTVNIFGIKKKWKNKFKTLINEAVLILLILFLFYFPSFYACSEA